MTTFDKREDSFEKKFAHDEALRFRAEARRNKMLGLWAAEKLGKSGADAETYSKEVIAADVAEQGEEDVYRKLRRDFDAAGHRYVRAPHQAGDERVHDPGDRADQSGELSRQGFLHFGGRSSRHGSTPPRHRC